MSYDLSIQHDEDFSRSTKVGTVEGWLLSQTGVKRNGASSYVLDDPARGLWMELDFEISNGAGADAEFDCIRAHIPYAKLGDDPETAYFPLLFGLARQLGWQVVDEQEGEVIFSDD